MPPDSKLTRSQPGFTLVELMIVIAIVGILAGIAAPVMNTFRKKAEFSNLMATLHQLEDGQDSYYILNNSFYPEGFGTININSGQEMDLPDLGFRFPNGHKHRYVIRGINLNWGNIKINYYLIYVYADEDYNGDGRNDFILVRSYFRDDEPLTFGNITYDRYFQHYW